LVTIAISMAFIGWSGYQHYHAKYIHVKTIQSPEHVNLKKR